MNNLAMSLPKENTYNVVGLNQNSIYNNIISFLNTYESKSTFTNYLRYYKQMCMYLLGKNLNDISIEDLKSITKKNVKNYRSYLQNSNYENTTINSNIFACKALWDNFIDDELLSENPFDLTKLKIKENPYDSLTSKEIEQLFDYCLSLKFKPLTKKLYFEFLYITTCRKNIAQSLTWDDIKKELDVKTGKEVWAIKFKDKGSYHIKAISDEFYNQLMQIYNEKDHRNKVFNIDNKVIDNTLKDFCKLHNITRHIVQHSVRSTGLDFIQSSLGDINITAEAAGHKNIQTTYNHYINKNKQLTQQPSYLLHKNYNIDMLKGLDGDTLFKLIEMCEDKSIVQQLCMQLEKLTN